MTLLHLLLALSAAAEPFSPSPHLDFERRPEELAAHCRAAKSRAEERLAALAAPFSGGRTFSNTPAALENALWDMSDEAAADIFLKDVSVSSAVRQASADCATDLIKFWVGLFAREDLYSAVKDYASRDEALPAEDKKLLDKQLLDFKRNGLLLAPKQRARVKAIKQRLVEIEQAFQKNLAEVKDFLLLSDKELEGLPQDYVSRLEKDGDRFKVTLDYPDYYPFLENAKNPDARRRLQTLYDSRAARENLPLLQEALRLRDEAARLLGYESHAAYVLEDRMAATPAAVAGFAERLEKRLKPLAREELARLLEFKKAEEGARSDGILHAWDWRYYHNQFKKARYELDQQKIKEYFPMETVTAGMLAVYQKLLGVRFRRMPQARVWHSDVSLYEITEAAGGEPLAYFYMDLYPREGKYKHAAAFDIIKGRRLLDGSYQKPVSAIVANFNKPSAGRPSLLKHGDRGEVETYFHEFGHIMHQTLTRARHGRFSGSSVAQDFVEAPSQMLENWVWDPAVLRSLSGHFQKPDQRLPAELLERMIAAKNAGSGLANLRQLHFSLLDLRYHSAPLVKDTTAVYRDLMEKVSLIPMTPGTHPEAGFGHLMGGYDAGYYGYLWSKVYAQDMFSRFEAAGLLDPAVGRDYRRLILEPGRSRDEMDVLREFLGREPNEDAFLKSIGLDPKRS